MENNTHSQGSREHLRKLVADFDTAMLVTSQNSEPTRARPMAVAKAGLAGETPQNDDLYFVTDRGSPKVGEIEHDPHVVVTFANRSQFVSVSGTAQISEDRQLIHSLWSEAWKVWFPQGKDDPRICLLHVVPTEAEYWDNSGFKGLRFMFEAAKSYIKGEKMDEHKDDKDQHNKVRL